MAKSFLDREKETEKFVGALHATCKLVFVEGETGTGKSMLLNQFRQLADRDQIPNKMVNFRGTSFTPLDIIYTIAELVGIDNCKKLKKSILDFVRSNDIVVSNNRLWFGSKITVQVASSLNKKDQNDSKLWYGQITSALFDDLMAADIKRMIIFFDTYEQCSESVAVWAKTHMLQYLGCQEKFLVVIAGQKALELDVEWEDAYRKISLGGLELHYWYQYMEKQQLKMNPEWILVLYNTFDGKPAAMTTALDKLLRQDVAVAGESDVQKYWALLSAYFNEFDPLERSLIEELAVFHYFDETIVENVWSSTGLKGPSLNGWNMIARLPFVSDSQGRTVYHELHRNAILSHLWRDKQELFVQYSERAASYFNRGDSSAQIERAYHLLICDPQCGREAFYNLVVDFQDTGAFSAWSTLNQYGLEHVSCQRLEPRSAALIWEAAGQYESVLGKYPEAIEYLDNSEYLYRQVDDKDGLLRTLYARAAMHSHLGRQNENQADLQAAYRLARQLDNPLFAGHVMYRIAEATNFAGKPEIAHDQYRESLAWFEKTDDAAMQARNLMFMAETSAHLPATEQKELYLKAVPLFEQGWARYEQMAPDDPGFSAATFIGGFSSRKKVKMFGLFNVAIDEGDCLRSVGDLEQTESRLDYYQRALVFYQRAYPLAQTMKDLRWMARSSLRLGDICVKLNQLDTAYGHFEEAIKLATRVGQKLFIGWANVGFGDIERLRGNRDAARQYYLTAQDLYLEVGANSNIAWQIKPNLDLSETG